MPGRTDALTELGRRAVRSWHRRRGTTPLAADRTGFYAAADPGDGPRGEVLASEAIDAPPGALAWRVRYRTADAQGRPVAASMALAARAVPTGERPVYLWVHGAIGVAPGCAPSRSGWQAVHGEQLLAAGAVVAAPDLTGLGVDGVRHPYVHGTTAGRSILDALRAASGVAAAGANGIAVLAGHSAGGHAVLWGNELAMGEDGDGLDVRDTIAISPISDLASAMALYGTMDGAAAYPVQLAATWPDVEPVDAADVLTDAALERLDELWTKRLEGLLRTFDGDPRRWLRGFEAPAWQAALLRQSAGRHGGRSPVDVVQGGQDVMVPDVWCDALVAALRAAGCPADLHHHPGEDHMSVLASSAAHVIGRARESLGLV